MAICDINLNYVPAAFLDKIHNCNEFNHPYRTANNALNVKAYNYSVEDGCLVLQEQSQKWLTALLECVKMIIFLYE